MFGKIGVNELERELATKVPDVPEMIRVALCQRPRTIQKSKKKQFAAKTQKVAFRTLVSLRGCYKCPCEKGDKMVKWVILLFYICPLIGMKMSFRGKEVFIISPKTPLGELLMGKVKGAKIQFDEDKPEFRTGHPNIKTWTISEIV